MPPLNRVAEKEPQGPRVTETDTLNEVGHPEVPSQVSNTRSVPDSSQPENGPSSDTTSFSMNRWLQQTRSEEPWSANPNFGQQASAVVRPTINK